MRRIVLRLAPDPQEDLLKTMSGLMKAHPCNWQVHIPERRAFTENPTPGTFADMVNITPQSTPLKVMNIPHVVTMLRSSQFLLPSKSRDHPSTQAAFNGLFEIRPDLAAAVWGSAQAGTRLPGKAEGKSPLRHMTSSSVGMQLPHQPSIMFTDENWRTERTLNKRTLDFSPREHKRKDPKGKPVAFELEHEEKPALAKLYDKGSFVGAGHSGSTMVVDSFAQATGVDRRDAAKLTAAELIFDGGHSAGEVGTMVDCLLNNRPLHEGNGSYHQMVQNLGDGMEELMAAAKRRNHEYSRWLHTQTSQGPVSLDKKFLEEANWT